MTNQWLLLTGLLFSLCAYGQEEISWNTRTDSIYSYAVEYPAGWEYRITKKEGKLFSLLGPQAAGSAGEGTAIIQLTLKKVKVPTEKYPGFNLEQYIEQEREGLKNYFKDAESTNEKVEGADGPAYHKVKTTYTKFGQEVYSCVHYYLVNERLYVLDFTCGQDSDPSIIAAGEKILERFKLE